MTSARLCLITCHLIFAVDPLRVAAGLEEASKRPIRYPAMTVTNELGDSLPLFSLAAYRAEFRYLRRVLHEIDLSGPPVKTDGWTGNIAEAEWPWMSCAYLGYSAINLAKADSGFRETALAEVRWLLEAMQRPGLSGFINDHFGPPFGGSEFRPSVFVHGHWLQLAVRYREASGDDRYDALIRRVATALSNATEKSNQGILKSYRDMWWVSDNLPSLSALKRYDRLFNGTLSVPSGKFVRNVKEHYLDPKTGLISTYINADAGTIQQGARGISTMYGLHFLGDVDPGFARAQWAQAKTLLVRRVLGLTGAREFADGSANPADIDSGPVIFGLGPSASGFGIAAAAQMGDSQTAWDLAWSATLVGLPVHKADELQFTTMPVVGQTVILFGKTLLLEGLGQAQP